MIGYLRGKVISRDVKSVLLDVGGVGYRVFVNSGEIETTRVTLAQETELFTYLAVRENALDLYGFERKEEIDSFELLLNVSGIGPKSAMAILAVASPGLLHQAISTEDASYLAKTSGIGKKTAEKIVLELKDKIDVLVLGGEPHTPLAANHTDALLALQSLGYSERESREALKKASGETTEEKVRAALKRLTG